MATLTTRLQLRKPDGVDLVNVLTDIVQNMDKIDSLLPGGEAAYAEKISDTTGILAVDTTIVSVTWTVPTGGRKYKITIKVYTNSTVATDTVISQIMEGASIYQVAVHGGGFQSQQVSRRIQISAGVHTIDLKIKQNSGTGTITNNASASWPSFLLVEDIGPF